MQEYLLYIFFMFKINFTKFILDQIKDNKGFNKF